MDMEIHDRDEFALPELDYSEPPPGSDRRSFMMRSAMAAAIVAVGGQVNPLFAQAPAGPPLGAGDPVGGSRGERVGTPRNRASRAREARSQAAARPMPRTSSRSRRSSRIAISPSS